jgi:glucose/arabinose dehydrogenase/cytochrome c2
MMMIEAVAANGRGQARIAESSQAYWVEQICEGLSFPSSMAWLPNGDILITERIGGRLRIVRGNHLDPTPISGTPASFQNNYDGLKEIALDPDYPSNQMVYLLISEGTFAQHHVALYRARFEAHTLKDPVRIFRSEDDISGAHGTIASRATFLADKTLLLAIAEDRPVPRAQQLNSQKGKILRINRDGSIPKDNPFLNTPGALPEVWTYGHRVVLGLYQDEPTGPIWEVEAGPRGGDELNILRPGANYGYANVGWGFAYENNGLETPIQTAAGVENPIAVWTPSVTPSGIARNRGAVYPFWTGNYFIGHLTNMALERLRIEDDRVVLREQLLVDLKERIRDVKMGPDNHIYVLTDNNNGRLLRLQPGRPRANQLSRVARKLEQPVIASPIKNEQAVESMTPLDLAAGRQAFLERCSACHSVGPIVQGGQIGPDLAGVYGKLMGRKKGFDYSPALAGHVISWDFATLDAFLTDVNSIVPGTKMAAPPVTEAHVRRQIVGFLKQQSSPP